MKHRPNLRRGAPLRAPKRKRIRLPAEVYVQSGQPFLITICTVNRRAVFAEPRYAGAAFRSLLEGPVCREADAVAVCLMPDHLHLLLIAKHVSLISLVDRWKTYTTNLLHKMGFRGPIWQRSFYDHALRREEDVAEAARYVISNPVRKGLVEEWKSYPYSWLTWED